MLMLEALDVALRNMALNFVHIFKSTLAEQYVQEYSLCFRKMMYQAGHILHILVSETGQRAKQQETH
jgi:hypothetical protein